jgi:nucleoid-associated protein YgaU
MALIAKYNETDDFPGTRIACLKGGNMDEEKKSLFDKAVDALTSRDEKAAADAAKQDAAEAMAQANDAARRANDAEAQLRDLQSEKDARDMEDRVKAAVEQQAAAYEAAQPKYITENHVLTAVETLSHLSLKYYGSAVRDYWMVIYEANKEQIGPNPALVRVGMILKIPVLPPNLPMMK